MGASIDFVLHIIPSTTRGIADPGDTEVAKYSS